MCRIWVASQFDLTAGALALLMRDLKRPLSQTILQLPLRFVTITFKIRLLDVNNLGSEVVLDFRIAAMASSA